MAKNWAKNLKYKIQYNKYFKAEKKKRTPLRNIQKYGTWLKLQKSGGSVRTKRELQGLSGADADAVKKLLYGKKG